MRRKPLFPPGRRLVPGRAWPALAAGLVALAAIALALAAFAARDPLRRGWRASAGQPYRVAGETRVEHGPTTARYRVAGAGDGTGRLTVDIAPLDAGAAGAGAAVTATFRIDGPSVVAADGVTVPLRALGARLPVGDPLVLLATAHAPRAGGLEAVGARRCRRVDFVVGARAYGRWWEAHAAYLPVNANAGGLWTFDADGTAWLDPATALPCRIAAAVRLPRLVDDSAGRGWADWTYDWTGGGLAPR